MTRDGAESRDRGMRHGRMGVVRMCAVACALVTILPAGATARRPSAPSARILTGSQAAALRAGAVTVRLTSVRATTVRLTASVLAGPPAGRRAIARSRTVRLRSRRPRVVALRLTAAGRTALRSCKLALVGVTVRAVKARTPARSLSRGLSSGRPECRRPTAPTLASAPASPTAGAGDWATWQHDLGGSRFNADERTLTPAVVAAGLEPKWSFVFPDSDGAQSSQPAVVGDTLYVGGRNGKFYALDARTGVQRWSFDTRSVTGVTQQRNLLRDGPAVADGLVVFGDFLGNMYALEAATGKLRWVTEVDSHPLAILTGSPLIYQGRVYVGVSSNEVFTASSPTYPCCQFRGSFVALDEQTGRIDWRHYTTAEPQRTGTNSFGAPTFTPSGVSVWSSPAVDPATDTVFFGTSQNYTGNSPEADSVEALDAKTGRVRWTNQRTKGDQWSAACLTPVPGGNCPSAGPDFDVASSPNVFRLAGNRTVVGVGAKSGRYALFDAASGDELWSTVLNAAQGEGGAGGQNGIQWGTSYDGTRLYAATNQADPGALFAMDPSTGHVLWRTPSPPDGCSTGGAAGARPGDCTPALPAAVTATPGVVWEGSRDGKMRAYDAATGRPLWQYDTVQRWLGTNGQSGMGGSISGSGAVVSHGMVYVNSGYLTSGSPFTGIQGSVLIAFGPKGAGR